jgi:hypothetical protein
MCGALQIVRAHMEDASMMQVCRSPWGDTRSSTAPYSKVEIFTGWSKVAVDSQRTPTLQKLLNRTFYEMELVQQETEKSHKTPGFFCYLLRRALQALGAPSELVESDWGAYADVGHHTNARRMSTCWPLVTNMLQQQLAGQVLSCWPILCVYSEQLRLCLIL